VAEELDILRASLRLALDEADEQRIAEQLGTSRTHLETPLRSLLAPQPHAPLWAPP
jgi:hypothetical protein